MKDGYQSITGVGCTHGGRISVNHMWAMHAWRTDISQSHVVDARMEDGYQSITCVGCTHEGRISDNHMWAMHACRTDIRQSHGVMHAWRTDIRQSHVGDALMEDGCQSITGGGCTHGTPGKKKKI
jgi:hypothetical protein